MDGLGHRIIGYRERRVRQPSTTTTAFGPCMPAAGTSAARKETKRHTRATIQGLVYFFCSMSRLNPLDVALQIRSMNPFQESTSVVVHRRCPRFVYIHLSLKPQSHAPSKSSLAPPLQPIEERRRRRRAAAAPEPGREDATRGGEQLLHLGVEVLLGVRIRGDVGGWFGGRRWTVDSFRHACQLYPLQPTHNAPDPRQTPAAPPPRRPWRGTASRSRAPSGGRRGRASPPAPPRPAAGSRGGTAGRSAA